MVARRQLDRAAPERARERAPEPAEARPVAPVPARLLALQRGVGNHAVTRMLQRKVDDLPVNPTVDPKLAEKIQAYNRTPRIAELEGAAAERQRKLDQDALGGLADMAYAIEGKDEAANSYLTDLRQQIDAQSMGLIQAQPSKPAVQLPPPKAQVRPEETLEVEDFPHEALAAPPQKNASMFTLETMRVKIGGKPYRLWAGQNYLNPTGSTRYQKSAADIKSGPVKVLVSGDQAMVGDSHHRFVWKAFHRLAMTATVKPVFGLPADRTAWNVLTYKLDPKNEYEFSPTDPANADLRLAAASPLPEWQGFADWPLDLLTEHIGKARKNSGISVYAEELPPLRDHLRTARVWSFRAFVQDKVQQATNQAHAKALAKIMLGSFQWGYEPNVMLGRTPSQGYWSKEHHVIVLDPFKNPSANALLDTLAYESGNALGGRTTSATRTSRRRSSPRSPTPTWRCSWRPPARAGSTRSWSRSRSPTSS